jgi:hypothetical protein
MPAEHLVRSSETPQGKRATRRDPHRLVFEFKRFLVLALLVVRQRKT